jgi:RNA polymerase sigma factor (TIGR02999 family)
MTPSPTPDNITQLLKASSGGDREALERLLPAVYAELQRQAARYLRRERPGHTLETTALVHEAYLRLVDQRQVQWQNRAHFFGISAQLMRRILVDHARGRGAVKRGKAAVALPLDEWAEAVAAEGTGVDLLTLDDALTRLAEFDPDQARIVELRYFSGLSIEETAAVLGVSPATVKRDWSVARAWLKRELSDSG